MVKLVLVVKLEMGGRGAVVWSGNGETGAEGRGGEVGVMVLELEVVVMLKQRLYVVLELRVVLMLEL